MGNPLRSDLSWEDIAKNIATLKAIHERIKDGRPPGKTYLDEIQLVNQALQAGAHLRIEIAAHGFVTPLGDAHLSPTLSQQAGSVLVLQKILVTFQESSPLGTYNLNVSLIWHDMTHDCNQTWGAVLPQPQWQIIVQQAQAFLQEHLF